MGNRFSKPVAFNRTSADDQELLKYLEGKNFSGYVKELIKADMQRREQPLKIVKKSEGGGLKIVIGG